MCRGCKCFMSCSMVYETLEYFDHLACWFQLPLPQYLDCYETDSHTKKCFGDQFCSSVLLCAFLSMSTLFCFWYGCQGFIKQILGMCDILSDTCGVFEALKTSEQIGRITFEIQF